MERSHRATVRNTKRAKGRLLTSDKTNPACPFCGVDDIIYTLHHSKCGAVECAECGAMGPEVGTGNHAKPDAPGNTTEWHKRALAVWRERKANGAVINGA